MNETKSREEINNFLVDTKNQIVSFDNKAGTLLSIEGILFGLIMNFANLFNEIRFIDNKSNILKNLFILFFILFCFFAFVSMVHFVLVIVPRRRIKKGKQNSINSIQHVNYYGDVAKMNFDCFKNLFKIYDDSLDVMIQQVINNAIICEKKHKYLIGGIANLLIFTIVTFGMIIISIIF